MVSRLQRYDLQQRQTRGATSAAPRVIARLIGIAVPLNQNCFIALPDGDHSERFLSGCFAESIARGNVRLKIDHETPVDGRLDLFQEPNDLRFRFHVFDTTLGRQTLERVALGASRGCSIGFRHVRGGEYYRDGVHHITTAHLTEISICFRQAPLWYGTPSLVGR